MWCIHYSVVTILWILILSITVDGFMQRCQANQTIFASEGSSITFHTKGESQYVDAGFGWLVKYTTSFSGEWVLEGTFRCCDAKDVYFHPFYENRSSVIMHSEEEDYVSINITINGIERADNGTYVLELYPYRSFFCWILFVMEIARQPSRAIEENESAYFYGEPKASMVIRPLSNASMVWLVDGRNVTESQQFVLLDGKIWVASVPRTLNGRNITYRAIQDSGEVNEVNYTVKVTYGPEAPLELSPAKEHYFLTSGQVMPDVSCSVECSPSCKVSWDTHSKGNILSLGKVSTTMTGTYTCTATRPGTDITVKRRLVVQVEAFTIAIAVVASIQAITTIILIVCGIYIYRRNNVFPCRCSNSSKLRDNGVRKTLSGHENNGNDINETELEHYEELDSEGRTKQHLEQYEDVQTPAKTAENMYVNTKIA